MLLIDEIDRADDDFEAFLLELLADASVTIPELGTIRATHPPVIVLTSNRTRDLHDAVKRRCLYRWIDYPTPQREVEIIRRRVKGASETLAVQVADAVSRMRDSDVQKPPGIAEAIDWLAALDLLGIERLDADAIERTLGSVLKYDEDQEVIRAAGLERSFPTVAETGTPAPAPTPDSASRRSRSTCRHSSARSDSGFATPASRSPPSARPPSRGRSPWSGPQSRRRLYWAARSIFVSDRAHAAAFDSVYGEVFGEPAPSEPGPGARRPGGADTARRASALRAAGRIADGSSEAGTQRRLRRRRARARTRSRSRSSFRLRSQVTRSACPGSASTPSTPRSWPALYRLMSRLDLATPVRRTRRFERARHGRRVDLRQTLRASLRTGGDAIEIAQRRRRVSAARWSCSATSPARWSPTLAPTCSSSSCAAGDGGQHRGLRLRHPAHPGHAGARYASPRAGHAASRGDGAGLVERHPDRGRRSRSSTIDTAAAEWHAVRSS